MEQLKEGCRSSQGDLSRARRIDVGDELGDYNLVKLLGELIITHIFWDVFTSHGDKPSCIEETTYDLCFGNPLYRLLQKLVGNDKSLDGGVVTFQ